MPDENWYDPDVTTFGDRLAGARDAAGLNQADLARRLGVKVKTLRAWEGDQSEPRANRVSMLSGLLNVSLVWLMTGEGTGPGQPDETGEGADRDLLRALEQAHRDSARLTERLRVLEGRVRARLTDPA